MVLDAALSLLTKYGPDAMTIRRVATQLGVGAMTLYTYVEGQDGLRAELVKRGFQKLNEGCHSASEQYGNKKLPHAWWPGARSYIRFAEEHPQWFRLMFDAPMTDIDSQIMMGGFEPLLEIVRMALTEHKGMRGRKLEEEANRIAGRYWVGIHGLAMLATTGRLGILNQSVDELLEVLMPGVAPPIDKPTEPE